jgi:Rieske Fe-S protein
MFSLLYKINNLESNLNQIKKMTTTTSVQKQLLVNEIGNQKNVANELIDIIKSYAFYDTKTYNTIQAVKECKSEVNYIMKKVFLFYRFNYTGTNNLHCHWGVVLHTLDDELPKIHIISDTCNSCGDYIDSLYNINSNVNKPKKIMCKCHAF